MAGSRGKARVATWHRWLGLSLTIPLLAWVVSSAVMMSITMDIPNGLQGVYQLQPYNSVDIRLDEARMTPADILRKLSAAHGIDRVHWLRLESRGPHLWYVVRPTPFSLTMTFDARTGERIDPLTDELLALTANEALVGTRFQSLEHVPEFNRDYEIDRVPAARVTMVGEQPSILLLSRDNGRTLRRLDADAQGFHWWYKWFHTNQFTGNVVFWTTLLYLCVAGVILLAILGYQLFWWRRKRGVPVVPARPAHFSARNLHRKVGVVVGGVLIVQLLAGVYIWLSLGPLNDPFRGKFSFTNDWSAGFTTQHSLPEPGEVLARLAGTLPPNPRPVQAIEWRRLGNRDAWLITTRKDERPRVFDAATAAPIEALPVEVAGEIARQEVVGHPSFIFLGPLQFETMDLNRRVPAYRFRFNDAEITDVYVLQNTGEIVMRRPAFWRLFGPFLAVHMVAITRNKVIDMTLLALFQIAFLAMIVTGWRLQFPGKRGDGGRRSELDSVPEGGGEAALDANEDLAGTPA